VNVIAHPHLIVIISIMKKNHSAASMPKSDTHIKKNLLGADKRKSTWISRGLPLLEKGKLTLMQ